MILFSGKRGTLTAQFVIDRLGRGEVEGMGIAPELLQLAIAGLPLVNISLEVLVDLVSVVDEARLVRVVALELFPPTHPLRACRPPGDDLFHGQAFGRSFGSQAGEGMSVVNPSGRSWSAAIASVAPRSMGSSMSSLRTSAANTTP